MPLRFTFTYKTYIEICCYVVLLFFVIPIRIDTELELREQFVDYLRIFNKSYPQGDEFNSRFTSFKKSLENINILNTNRTNSSARYGLTKFSDMSPEEFISLLNNRPNGTRTTNNEQKQVKSHVSERSTTYWKSVPMKIDWRDQHVISKVKYQKDCGACWAFAVTETIESMQAIKTHHMTELSVQQMIDCSRYNNGCQGGDTCLLLQWIKNYDVSIATETDYPLTRKDQKCKKSNIMDGVRIKEFSCNSFVGREDIILKLLAINGPVTVGISGQTWQHYVGGVVQFHCDGHLNHAVQIVGYDLTTDVPHYIVRNSWGEDFGDGGYLYVAIGGNVCGLANEVAAITVV